MHTQALHVQGWAALPGTPQNPQVTQHLPAPRAEGSAGSPSRKDIHASLGGRRPCPQRSRRHPAEAPKPGLEAGKGRPSLTAVWWLASPGLSDASSKRPGRGGLGLRKPEQPEPRAPDADHNIWG